MIGLLPAVVLHSEFVVSFFPMFFDPPITAPELPSGDQNQAPVGEGSGAS